MKKRIKKKKKRKKREEKKENKAKQTTGVLKNVMQEDWKRNRRKGCKNNIRAEEELVARTKQHEEDNCCGTGKTTRRGRGYRHKAGGEGHKGQEKSKEKNPKIERQHVSLLPSLSRSPIDLNEKQKQQKLPLTCRGFRLYMVVAHAPLISRPGPLPHDLPCFRFSNSSTAISVRLPSPPPSPRYIRRQL